MGVWSSTAKGSNPMTTGGSGSPGTGKNKSPHALGDTTNAQTVAGQTRVLAKKFSSSLNTDKSLSKVVAGRGIIGNQ